MTNDKDVFKTNTSSAEVIGELAKTARAQAADDAKAA